MNKVLFFASDFKIGLSALLTDELIAFHQSGANIYAVAGEHEQEIGLSEKVDVEKVPISRIEGLDAHANFGGLAKILEHLILANDIHIVHVQNNWQLALMSFVKYKLLLKHKIRIIYTLHGFRHNSVWKSYLAQIIIGSALLLFTDKVICMSSYLKRKFRLLSYKIELLPLGVPTSFFVPEMPPLPQDGLQMIFPAQFRYGKNQDVIIRSFAEHIKNTRDDVSKLILPGAGDLLSEMKALAVHLNIASRVEFPGQLSKEAIRQLYLKSNIGIVSSNSETFGQSIVEPFVLGRCVVSTPVGIALDIIKKGENGYIYNHQEGLTQIMSYLYSHQELISKIGQNNFIQRDLFNWDTISKTYQKDMLADLLGK